MSYAQTVRLCLSSWITHLLTAVPPRSRATFVELLCGCLISPEGWVTRAISAIRHDHAKKANQTQFVQAQCWVTLGVSVLPIVSRLVPVSGNRNKLTIALSLVRGLAPVMKSKPVRILFDACFMWARLVLPLLSRKMRVIGQARRDTALFLPPVVLAKRGRGQPRKYGLKMTPDAILALPAIEVKLTLYGKEQLIRLRSVVAMARFLKGTPVRAVWSEFYDVDKQRWSKARLLLATKTHRAGTMDANSLHGMDIGAITEFDCRRKFPHHRRFTVVRQASADRRISGAMAAHGIYRTCLSG